MSVKETKNIDFRMLFLEILDEYYERTGSTVIRRATVLDLVERRIVERTEGSKSR